MPRLKPNSTRRAGRGRGDGRCRRGVRRAGRGRAASRSRQADPADLDPGVLRASADRRGGPARRRRPPARQGACQRAYGRTAGRDRALSGGAVAEPDHRREFGAAADPARRARPARRVLRRRHQGRRHRPQQRRAALPRDAEARRQRVHRRRPCRRCNSWRASPTSTTIRKPIRSATSSPSSAPRAASAPRRSATTRPG